MIEEADNLGLKAVQVGSVSVELWIIIKTNRHFYLWTRYFREVCKSLTNFHTTNQSSNINLDYENLLPWTSLSLVNSDIESLRIKVCLLYMLYWDLIYLNRSCISKTILMSSKHTIHSNFSRKRPNNYSGIDVFQFI